MEKIEILGFKAKTSEVWKYVEENVLQLPPVTRNEKIGGWSVLSSDGTWQDGWQTTFLPMNGPGNEYPSWIPKTPEEQILKTMQDCSVPTNICNGPLKDLVNQIEQMGFWPRRARIIRLSPGCAISWHVDSPKGSYAVRMHIPLKTNPKSFFDYEDISYHLKDDGSVYLLDVSQSHRVRNDGDTYRYHLVLNVWDRHRVSRHFQFTESLGQNFSL